MHSLKNLWGVFDVVLKQLMRMIEISANGRSLNRLRIICRIWLQAEIDGLCRTHDKVFQSQLIEWIEERLSQFRVLLEIDTNDSALVLPNLLGPVILKVKYPDIGKPYYLTYTSIMRQQLPNHCPTAKSRTMVRLHSNGGHGRKEFELLMNSLFKLIFTNWKAPS